MNRKQVVVVFNYRSPFCALAVDRLFAIGRRYSVEIIWRIVRDVPRPSSLPITEDNPRFLYNRQDCRRRARWLGLSWDPPAWRLSDVAAASRLGQWLLATGSPLFEAYSKRVSRAYWQERHNISDAAVIERLAREVGISDAELEAAAAATADTEAQLDANGRWCEDNRVLGVPFLIIDEERFWGSDRVAAVEHYLTEMGCGPCRLASVDGVLFLDGTVPALPVIDREEKVAVRRIFCVGRNYRDHALEMGADPEREPPFFFMKPTDDVILSGAQVPYPPETSNFHYEMELVVVVGKSVARATAEAASAAVFGYAAGLDLTRRDLQLAAREKGRPWEFGKAFDCSAVIGPIRAAEDLDDAPERRLTLSVNGTTRQNALLTDMIWSVPEIISNLSNYYELRPGDVIFTGTPAGVGSVVPGDQLHGGISGIGNVSAVIGPPRL